MTKMEAMNQEQIILLSKQG